MTLKEIARLAGVSPSTVSRVLNIEGGKFASREVSERIWKLAEEHGYLPNQNAKQLRLGQRRESRQSKTLAIVFGRTEDVVSDPFFSKIAHAAQMEAYQKGYLVKYHFSVCGMSKTAIERVTEQVKADGILVLGRFDKHLYSTLAASYRNVVYAALNPANLPCDQVVCDGYKGAVTAVEYLIKSGHSNIGYIGEQSAETRYTAYRDTMKRHKLPLQAANIISCTPSTEEAYAAVCYVLEKRRPPTAFFCINDVVAIGALRALKERGYVIPKDVSIVSIDDIELATSCDPMLTTVSIPKIELGRIAVKLLVDRIEGGHKIHVKAELPFTLIKRESVYELL